ncbi:MAG: DNA-directed RNA polymerase [Candidatus Aenigmarchaeota archaeon]|nr:DNA-directed RNA polymerase [Candidatus Aenigmarchaeota archaeon]
MYKILEVSERIRVPPDKFSLNLEDAVKSSLEEKLEGSIDKNIGVILAILSIDNIGEGVILAGDGALYYPVEFKLLAYLPEQHELVKGDVIDVTEFGVFIRMGPVDGMVHVSQLMDDFVSYDSKNLMFMGKKTKRRIREKSQVLARVISVSMIESQYKIGLTTRQPGLGSLEWYKKGEKKLEVKKERPKKKKK